MTLTDMISTLKDSWDLTAFWTDEEARRCLNEALRTWSILTGKWKERQVMDTIAGQVYYPLPTGMIYPLRVEFNNHPLSPSSQFDQDEGHPGWEAQTTLTPGVPSTPSVWLPVDFQSFAIWPADAIGSNSLLIDGIVNAPTLINPLDQVDFNASDLSPLLGFAVHVASFKEGGVRFQSTQSFFEDFIKAAANQNARLTASALFREAMGLDTTQTSLPLTVT